MNDILNLGGSQTFRQGDVVRQTDELNRRFIFPQRGGFDQIVLPPRNNLRANEWL